MGNLLNPNTYVEETDSTENIFVRSVIGNKQDTHCGTSTRSILHKLDEHVHSVQKCFPILADCISIPSAASSWTYGDYVEIVPVNTITNDFDIHLLNISNISTNDEYEIQIASGNEGSEISIACVSFERTLVMSQEGSVIIQTPVIPANSRISAKLASKSTVANSASFKIHYHTY